MHNTNNIELEKEKDLLTCCFLKCGMSLRDDLLPRVDTEYVRDALSLANLSAASGQVIRLSTSRVIAQRLQIKQYYDAGIGFRKFYFAIESTSNDHNTNEEFEILEQTDLITQNIRRLFKLRVAKNTPRGAPGRTSTASVALESADE